MSATRGAAADGGSVWIVIVAFCGVGEEVKMFLVLWEIGNIRSAKEPFWKQLHRVFRGV
jgi:hypothetical protein